MSKIITISELQRRSLQELHGLQREMHAQLARSEPGSAERRNALANLENIGRAISLRHAAGPPLR